MIILQSSAHDHFQSHTRKLFNAPRIDACTHCKRIKLEISLNHTLAFSIPEAIIQSHWARGASHGKSDLWVIEGGGKGK